MPSIEILGIYRPKISAEQFAEQNELYDDEEQTREHFAKLVLVEVVISDLTSEFDFGDFSQPHPTNPKYDQVAYHEALLNADGTKLLDRGFVKLEGSGPFRCAFYLHEFDSAKSLKWTYGEVQPVALQEIPQRLQDIVPYQPTS